MRPLRTASLLLTGLAVAVALSACASPDSPAAEPAPAPDPLPGSSWTLASVRIGDALTPAAADASLNFGEDGQLSGSTGCNRLTGTWSGDAEALELTLGGTTLMACIGAEQQAQEQAVLDQLPLTRSATIAEGQLTLKDEGDEALAVYATAVTDFAGTSWAVTGVNNGNGAVVTSDATGRLTLEFGQDGAVTGFAGCTDFSGTAVVDGTAVSFTELAPAQDCTGDAGAAALQQEYLAALGNATVAQIDGTQVTLRDSEGATQVSLVQQ
jgi:heat shock protein HslJ